MPPPPVSILISRTDAIGDVVLTLPVAAVLKDRFPEAVIGFLGKPYTRPVLESCPHVDVILEERHIHDSGSIAGNLAWDAVVHVLPNPAIARWAKEVGCSLRIGTTNRLYHWWTCNKLVPLSRKNSDRHEAQLNLKLLKPLGISEEFSLDAIRRMRLLEPRVAVPDWLRLHLRKDRSNIILHPTSMGSARDWGIQNFTELAAQLVNAGYTVFITGTEKDRPTLQPMLEALGNRIHDLSGRLSLPELISFIAACDGLVAGSTGPLHIAAALGIVATGLYPAERPMHPRRWAPLGPHASFLKADALKPGNTTGLPGITVDAVFEHLGKALQAKGDSHSRIV